MDARLNHPIFRALIPYMKISPRRSPKETPRIEIAGVPDGLREAALAATWECPADGVRTHFIRARKQNGDQRTPATNMFLAVACLNAENPSCNRRSESKVFFKEIVDVVQAERKETV